MHEIRKRLLSLATYNDLSQFSYRQLAERVGATHAAQVRHHLLQLERQQKLVRLADGSLVAAKGSELQSHGALLSIPVRGQVDCGIATKFAADRIEGYLSISPSSTRCKNIDGIFALQACGDSMNDASIDGKKVDDSDYVLVQKFDGNELDGKYVVSLLDGHANLKKFRKDKANHRIALISESSNNYPPIFIAEDDQDYYQVIGVAVDVIKGIRHLVPASLEA